jgi:anti-sigma factor ChrR (cupin superfamily)
VAEAKSVEKLVNGGWRHLTFAPFREGLEICSLVDGGNESASVAVLRYRPGASVPLHIHHGLETVLVLEGSQSDERGCYRVGDVVFNPAGTTHSVRSEEGCVVFIQWERPVEILEDERQTEASG